MDLPSTLAFCAAASMAGAALAGFAARRRAAADKAVLLARIAELEAAVRSDAALRRDEDDLRRRIDAVADAFLHEAGVGNRS